MPPLLQAMAASKVIAIDADSARDTVQPAFASSARAANCAESMPGTRARLVISIPVIVGLVRPSIVRTMAQSIVSTENPALRSIADRHSGKAKRKPSPALKATRWLDGPAGSKSTPMGTDNSMLLARSMCRKGPLGTSSSDQERTP